MMDSTPTLTDQAVLDYARKGLAEHLPLHAGARVCTGEDLLHILLGMSAGKKTIHALCASHREIPSDATIRNCLNEQLTVDRLAEVEHQINAALASQIPRRVFKRPRDTGMDYHEQAYYGITTQAEGLWVRVKAGSRRSRARPGVTAWPRRTCCGDRCA